MQEPIACLNNLIIVPHLFVKAALYPWEVMDVIDGLGAMAWRAPTGQVIGLLLVIINVP
jgi:hypothetical protein